MIKVGERAPNFTAPASNGREISLSALRGHPVVIFFFPKAFTAGWTKETSQFCDVHQEIQKLGGEVIGISTDPLETNAEFGRSRGATYPFIGDVDRSISSAFGVLWPIIGRARRVTFVIDGEGVVVAQLWNEIDIGKHREVALSALAKLATGKSSV